MIRIASKFALALLMLLAIEADPIIAQTDDTGAAAEIEQLLIELGGDSFAARQRAMKKIWRSGNLSIDVLRRYAKTADPDAAERINRIILHMEMGISPETDPEVARLVYSFHSADEDRKFSMMHKLREGGHHKLVMDLLMALEDLSLREYLAQNAYDSGAHLVEWIMPSGFDATKIKQLDSLMDHPYMWQTHIDDCVFYWQLRSQARQRMDRLEQLAARKQATDEQLMRLVWFHRIAGNLKRSLVYARKLSDPKPEVVQRLLLETGDWKSLSRVYQGHLEFDENDIATQCKKAMFCYWTGDKQGFENARPVLPATQERTVEMVRQVADANAILAVLTLDRDQLERQIDEMSPGFAFQLLSYLQDYERAFRLLDAPRDFPEIKKWYRTKIRQLQRKVNNYQNLDSSSDLVEALDLFGFLRHYASTKGMLGYDQQAIELFELLADGLRVNGNWFRDWNAQVFEDLVALDPGEEVWRFFDILQMNSEINYAIRALFPDCFAEALGWYRILGESVPDPVERCQLIMALLQGSQATARKPDLLELVVRAREFIEGQPEYSQPHLLFQIGETCEALGYHDLARDFWLQSGFHGNSDALGHIGDLAAKSQDWRAAKQWYERARQIDSERNPAGFKAALCELKLGNPKISYEMLQQLRLQVMNSYLLYVVSDAIREIDFPDQALELAELFVRGKQFQNNDLYFEYLYLATIQEGSDHQRSALNRAIAIHFDLDYLARSGAGGVQYHVNSTKQHVATALHLLGQGDMEQSFETMVRCAGMTSVSTSLAETLVPCLDGAGEKQKADELFELIADQYLTVLRQYPDSAIHHNNYAWTCARCSRRLSDSLAHAERAVQLEPDNTSYLDTLAEAAFRNGDTKRAIGLSDRCIVLNPFKPVYREQRRRFAKAMENAND